VDAPQRGKEGGELPSPSLVVVVRVSRRPSGSNAIDSRPAARVTPLEAPRLSPLRPMMFGEWNLEEGAVNANDDASNCSRMTNNAIGVIGIII